MGQNTQVTPIINLSAKMNTRSNNEVLDVSPNDTGIELSFVQNGDLFYTKALAARQGVIDIAGGVLNATESTSVLFDTYTPTGTTDVFGPIFLQDKYYDRQGMLFNGISGTNVYSGMVYIQGTETALPYDMDYDLRLNMWIHAVQGTPHPTSGSGGIINIQSPFNVDVISTSGFSYDNLNTLQLFYPQTTFPPIDAADCKPQAISQPTTFNLGAYTGTIGNYATAVKAVPFSFYAPYPFYSNSTYYLKMVVNNTSGTGVRGLQAQYLINAGSGSDYYPNAVEAKERINGVTSQYNALFVNSTPATTKTWLSMYDYEYPTPSYALVDYPSASFEWSIPAKNGSIPNGGGPSTMTWSPVPGNTNSAWPGLTQSPSSGTTNVIEFGNLMTIPSGVHTIQGGYCYLGIISGNGWSNYTVNRSTFPSNGYNVNYVGELSTVTASGGSWIKGNVLATFTGNHIFNDPYTYVAPTNASTTFDPATESTQTQLDKVYAMFDNPYTFDSTGTQVMMSWKMLDSNTNQQLTDYIAKTRAQGLNWYYTFASPIIIGMNRGTASVADRFVINDNNDGFNFRPWQSGGGNYNLTCGLVSIPSGNAVTSVYDYRVGDTRTQEIIFTQRDKVQAFNDYDPQGTMVTIWTGAAVGNNYKWSHSTFQGELFSHQYSQTSGVCWDQIYYNPSGQTMQYHGKRPVCVGTSDIITLPSGSSGLDLTQPFEFILATAMNSGGFRSSEVFSWTGISASGISPSGANALKLTGVPTGNTALYPYDIQYTGINNGKYQYNFDVNSLGTYVFATQSSGAVWFYAPLCDVSGNAVANPLPNVNTWDAAGSGVYIFDNQFSGVNSIQVPNQINYDQTYLLNQIDTPKFKKTIIFKNILFGIGDTNYPSRLWFSEQQGPQVFGVDTNFYGYYDLDNDNGQEITGVEIFKDYLIIFKENSCYRASYTANPGNPLDIFQISSTKGNLGIFTTVPTDYGVIGLNQFGPFLATYAGIESIGDEILPYFQTLDHADLIYSVAIHDIARQQIYWSITNSNISPDNQIGLVYSYAEKAWGVRQNSMWNSAGIIGDIDNFNKLYIGDTYGQIKQLDAGNSDQDVLFVDTTEVSVTRNISLEFETPWLNFGNSQNLKQLKFVKINCDSSDQKLRVDVYTDQNANTKKYSRYLNMNVPVINRVCSLSGFCRTVKLVITSVGDPSPIKINSIQFGYIDMGPSSNMW